MIRDLRANIALHKWQLLIFSGVLTAAAFFGYHADMQWVILLGGIGVSIMVLHQPEIGLLALIAAALILPIEFGTGTTVNLNPATILVPALLAIWILTMLLHGQIRLSSSRTTLPLFFFLASGAISLLIGRATWDPLVPVRDNFLLVQLAQWAIFVFSAGAFLLTANLIKNIAWMQRLTFFFLILAGILGITRTLPGLNNTMTTIATSAVGRAPFWALLVALAGGQLLFDRKTSLIWQAFLITIILASIYFGFFIFRESSSTWMGIGVALSALAWLRWPRLRWPLGIIITILTLSGGLGQKVYEFAGGDEAWKLTGGSRLALIQRVIEVTMRNPITGLGPAAYRPYADMKPLAYLNAFWIDPKVNSHNNYVDLFAQGGFVGLTLFFWFVAEVIRLGMKLRQRFRTGFGAGYVNGMLAVGAASLVLMLFADWLLPFVYNIGFVGFQASVLVWLFLGGLVALDNIPNESIS